MKKVLFSFASLVLGLAVINPVSAHATVEKVITLPCGTTN